MKHVELNTKIVNAALNMQTFKDNLIEDKCLYCNKIYQNKFDEIF